MVSRKSSNYFPGMHHNNRTTGSQIIENYFRQLDEKLIGSLKKKSKLKSPPCICLSRKIAIGAREVADILAERLNYMVIDRQIIEHMASNAELSQKTVEKFDERYPGKMNELMNFLFGENSFIPSDYSRQLTQSVLALSGLHPSIFVGRGTHLILPRDRTFSVRLTGSIETRVKRLGKIINKDEEACRIELARQDSEQASFFKKVYGKKDARSTEFDMVINRDYLEKPEIVADIIEFAFYKKFGKEIPGGK
ncbi:MAG: cytidylate kinase-like family protein [Deltaproteobacteria bacterium]|nr:MAG: cytidylate kinase-like family protein [Deltaproteobacteria bacterium]